MSQRRFFVGGNWKLNGSSAFVDSHVEALNAADTLGPEKVDVVLCPPYLYLDAVKQRAKSGFQVGAQNCSDKTSGAFTGEIAPEMLKDIGIKWTILGHSERRNLFGESDAFIGGKLKHAQEAGLSVIYCVGEHLSEREAGKTFDVCERQLQTIVDNVQDWNRLVIAYEPIWAIGTGVSATPEQAQEVHAHLRSFLSSKVSKEVAQSLRILYGGSVNATNCADLAKQQDIDGFLVGGASLKPEFATIINSASHSQ